MDSASVKAALDQIAKMLTSLSTEVGKLQAENWALREAVKEATKTDPQSVFEKVAAFRDRDAYRNIRDAHLLVASNVQEAVNRILL
jgi:cell division septum initiation protein DivIVA